MFADNAREIKFYKWKLSGETRVGVVLKVIDVIRATELNPQLIANR